MAGRLHNPWDTAAACEAHAQTTKDQKLRQKFRRLRDTWIRIANNDALAADDEPLIAASTLSGFSTERHRPRPPPIPPMTPGGRGHSCPPTRRCTVERGEGFFGTKCRPWFDKMLPMPSSDASEIWRRECETINQEMESLILSDWPRSHEENQVRKIQFMAMVKRRSEATRRFLSDAVLRPSRDSIAIDEPRSNR
jgi:hypothetical protein